jgi:hypothetical protein
VGDVVYDLGRDGLAFAAPVRLTLAYDPAAVTGPETSLRIAKLIEVGVGELVQEPVVDTSLHTVAGSLSSFSGYGVTGAPRPFYFSAEYQSDRSIRVSWTSGGGVLTVERATCVYPQTCGTPVPTDTGLTYGHFADGPRGELFDRSVPTVSAVYWYRIRNEIGRELVKQFVFIPGLPTAPEPATGFRAFSEPDGDILLRLWIRSRAHQLRPRVGGRSAAGLDDLRQHAVARRPERIVLLIHHCGPQCRTRL